MATLLKKTLGILLIIAGVAGLFLPILQGIALILLGLFLLQDKKPNKKVKPRLNIKK